MLGLLQLVVRELPIAPAPLADVAVLSLFVGPRKLPVDEPNGQNWCLRTYGTADGLVPLSEPHPARAEDPKLRKGERATYVRFPVRGDEAVDWPTRDHVPLELLDAWDAYIDFDERYSTQPGLKVGGWPLSVQAEVKWREGGHSDLDVDYVFQIDGEPKVGFGVGFGGVLYLGRRMSTGSWHITWQSM